VVLDVSDTLWAATGAPEPASVELRLSGPAGEIIRLARTGTEVRVPVVAVGSQDTLITLRRDWVVLGEGSGLIVESVTPAAIRVGFEPAVAEAVPISIRTQGTLPAHLALASPLGLNPRVVRVRGPASRVEGLDSIPLRPMDLARVTGSGVFELPVDTAGLAGVRVLPTSATVGIRVEERVERVLSGVPIIATAGASEASIVFTPNTVEVSLRGARTLVTAVDPEDLRGWVAPESLEGMAPGEERRVTVRVEGVPNLVTAVVRDDLVTVRRATEVDTGGVPGPESPR
jgi:YbbR domain-containing protein